MTGRHAIRLVARREIRFRVRERALLVSTLVTLAILAAIVLLPKLLGADGPDKATVAAPTGPSATLAETARHAQRGFGVALEVKRVGDDRAARRMVTDGDADAAVVAGGKALLAGDPRPDQALTLLQAVAVDAPPLPVTSVTKAADEQQRRVALVAVIPALRPADRLRLLGRLGHRRGEGLADRRAAARGHPPARAAGRQAPRHRARRAHVGVLEIAGSVALTAAATAALVTLAGRIYENGVLQTTRVGFR